MLINDISGQHSHSSAMNQQTFARAISIVTTRDYYLNCMLDWRMQSIGPAKLALKRYLDAGTSRCKTDDLRHKIRLTNGFCIALQLSLLMFALVDLARASVAEVAIDLGVAAVMGIPIALNDRGHYGLARFGLIVLTNCSALIDCYILGSGAGLPYLFVCTSTIACALYNLRERRTLTFSVGLSVVFFAIAGQFPESGMMGARLPFRSTLAFFNFGFCTLAMGAIVAYLNETNSGYVQEQQRLFAEREGDMRKMAQLGKMAALGQLAAGIAHEVNNPLTIIKGRARHLQDAALRGEADPTSTERLARSIDSTADRIARLVREMLAFARSPASLDLRAVHAKELVETTVEQCRETLAEQGLTITTKVEGDCIFAGDLGLVQQALTNLILNARDALVDINLVRPTTQTQTVHIHMSCFQAQIVIDVLDYGAGIPAAVVERIMEPFFTTKELGKGTGLGLSLSKGLLEALGGALELLKRADPTTFRITLPAAKSGDVVAH